LSAPIRAGVREVVNRGIAAARELPALLAAAGVAAAVEIGLRTMKLPVLARLSGTPLRDDDGTPLREADRLGLPPRLVVRMRAVRRVMRHWPFGTSCLRLALVSGQRIRSVQPVLRVGVMKDADGVRAHAWLEVDGVSLDPEARFEYAVVQAASGSGRRAP
ncbi:MAG TPA: lasso peptide biosynthesis B2 protein, partial [Acidothermaceae bacterium]